MRTEKQIEASRRNGARSKGPITPEGKANSAQNAVRHYLCAGPIILLTNEDSDEFNLLLENYTDRFQPIDPVEADIVHKLAAATWRDRRATSMETALLEVEMFHQQPEVDEDYTEITPEARAVLTLLGNHDDIRATAALLFRYGSTARRAYTAAFKSLRDLQGDRFNRQPEFAPAPLREPTVEPPATQAHDQPPPQSAAHQPAARAPHIPRAATYAVIRRYRAHIAAVKNTGLRNEPKPLVVAAGRYSGIELVQP
ncbi:MAG TPA: hypothetical protein VER03_22530 [Bryobacteraceae bacterium]|nr:hypothetical protein [Bryobacteraceae bacterium]